MMLEKQPFQREADRPWPVRMMHFWIAPFVDRWVGLSLTRVLAVAIFCSTVHLAHDWLRTLKDSPGWAFSTFVLTGFLLAVCTALGGKYILAFIQSKANPQSQEHA